MKIEQKARKYLTEKAESLGCPDNLKLAQYIEHLEIRLQMLEDQQPETVTR